MLSNPLTGAGYLLQGMRLITQPGLRRFVILPLVINILIFGAAIALGVAQIDGLLELLEASVPSWLRWLEWVLWPLLLLVLLVVVFYTSGMIANLLAAPFNGVLAEKTEALLTGEPIVQETGLRGLAADLLPTLVDEVRKLLYALLWAVPFLLLLLVPLVGPLLWFLYTAWMLAVEYCDFPLGNHGLKFREIRQRLRAQRGISLGFGAAVGVMAMVPLLNFILMPSAVAGATAMWVREMRSASRYQGPHESRVATRLVLLRIDHLSGRISGEILSGPLQGRSLEHTSSEELLDLLRAAYRSDAESAEALEVYLARERGHRIEDPRPGYQPEAAPTPGSQPMDANEARAILGIAAAAGADEIRAAHRRLIQRLHPDRGGSDYLAAKVNEARQVLSQSPTP